MMSHDAHSREPPTRQESPSTAGEQLTAAERQAIQSAAEAEGYSEMFAELLCRFAELIGTEEVLRELGQLESHDKQS